MCLFDCCRLKPDKLDTSRCFIVFDLTTGCISSRDVLSKDPQLLPTINAEPIGVGDTLTLEITGNKIVVVTDPQVNCYANIFSTLHLVELDNFVSAHNYCEGTKCTKFF